MEKELMMEILTNGQVRCTKKEAERHIADGTIIYEESEMTDYLFNYVNCGNEAEEAMEAWESLMKVEHNGVNYRIEFVL